MGGARGTRAGPSGRDAAWLMMIALVATSAASGCGESGPARRAVAGSITLDGKPLPSGTVVFAPLDGATAAVAEVSDGTYRLAPARGLAPGRYQVEVRAEAPTGKRVPHPDLPGETIEEVRNLIPPQFNARTELAVEVKPDADNTFDFALTSRATREPRRR